MSCHVEGVQKLDGLTPPDKACTTVVRANRAYNLEAASVIVACLGNPGVGARTSPCRPHYRRENCTTCVPERARKKEASQCPRGAKPRHARSKN